MRLYDKVGFWWSFAVLGICSVGVVTLSGIFAIDKLMDKHKREDAHIVTLLLRNRIVGYVDLLKVMPNPPRFVKNFGWLVDELQGTPGLIGIRLFLNGTEVLNTFPVGYRLSERIDERCFSGFEVGDVFYFCDSFKVSHISFNMLVARDIAFSNRLMFKVKVYGFLLWFVTSLCMLLVARSFHLKEKTRRSMEEKLKAVENLAVVGKTAAVIAHEIRNPLNVISMFLQCCDGERELLSMAIDSVGRISELTEELLSISKGIYVKDREFIVDDLVAQLELNMGERARRFGVSFEVDKRFSGVMRGDVRWLYRAVDNLVRNAFEHTKPDGSVKLSVFQRGKYVVFRVCNPGEPIPSDVAKKIFEPFFTTRSGGFGLGLYIVREVAKAHGGEVVLDQEEGEICFELRIPLGGGR